MVAPIHPQERRYARRLAAGDRAIIKPDGTWFIRDGHERWINDRWIDRMEAHGLITPGQLSVLSYHHWELTEAGEALARE